MGEVLPIIYVRGYSGGQGGIDSSVDDPFYGFNEGSTHIRVGAKGEPRFHQFEGPMLRLMLEDKYELQVAGSQLQSLLAEPEGQFKPNSLWVYRFYDEAAGTFGKEPEPYEIEKASQGLAAFIGLVRSKTAGNPRVNLVAHSMGGLICRAALQRDIKDPQAVVSKLCTIGTPHGGIDPELGGDVGDWFIAAVGPNGSDIFTHKRMKQYMLPDDWEETDEKPASAKWDPRAMVGSFPTDRVLSIVGTNARDYRVARGLSSLAMGEQSDGLVALRNAYVKSSARAYVHRSHSGRYGLVNSEEVYVNLKRFFLGSLRVQIELDGLDPARLKELVWQADVRLAIRKLPVLVHEQTAEHHCPVDLNMEARDEAGPTTPVPLISMFLAPKPGHPTCRYALSIKVTSLEQKHGWFGFDEHLEQIADWQDSLIVDLDMQDTPSGAASVTGGRSAWNNALEGRPANTDLLPDELAWERDGEGHWHGVIALPGAAKALLGTDAHLRFEARPWD